MVIMSDESDESDGCDDSSLSCLLFLRYSKRELAPIKNSNNIIFTITRFFVILHTKLRNLELIAKESTD